jgi:hypothetical protein
MVEMQMKEGWESGTKAIRDGATGGGGWGVDVERFNSYIEHMKIVPL